jgi:putative FmdB family regulatory protein
MPNYSYICTKCEHKEDHILSYEESIKDNVVLCEKCGAPSTKYFGKRAPMMIVPEGECGNAANNYTSKSNLGKK